MDILVDESIYAFIDEIVYIRIRKQYGLPKDALDQIESHGASCSKRGCSANVSLCFENCSGMTVRATLEVGETKL